MCVISFYQNISPAFSFAFDYRQLFPSRCSCLLLHFFSLSRPTFHKILIQRNRKTACAHFKVWKRRKKTKHWARLFQPTRRMYLIFLLNRNTWIYFTERTSTKDVYGLKTEIIFESCSYLNSDVYFSFVK